MSLRATDAPAPALEGIRAIDLSRDVAGAYAARLFADCGADVLKVEPPTGDPLRAAVELSAPAMFEALNAGKRSVAIDLAKPEGAELLKALVLDFDVLIEDCPPGEMESLGLGYRALAAVKPRLVVVSVTPFGLHGPDAGRRAADIDLFAAAGLDGAAAGPYAARLRAGLHAFAAGMMALLAAVTTEVGHKVEVAAIETLAATLPAMARVATSAAGAPAAFHPPFVISDSPAHLGRAPSLGEHMEEVLLGELGLEADEIARLRAEAVV